ncbi:nuclear transport factor 2 family protein [Leifsonia sp. LS-T14]|uniref:nuclear transport factor 2 family protein n=1 Tax=unclassified Leifsonia TaxID=2663824 RepID=UPI0035A631EF
MLVGDVSALDLLISNDLVFIGPDGSRISKTADLHAYRKGQPNSNAFGCIPSSSLRAASARSRFDGAVVDVFSGARRSRSRYFSAGDRMSASCSDRSRTNQLAPRPAVSAHSKMPQQRWRILLFAMPADVSQRPAPEREHHPWSVRFGSRACTESRAIGARHRRATP